MKRLYLSLFILHFLVSPAGAQTELTTQEAKTLYKSTSKKRVSVHDPSVVYEPTTQRYYIFGSHKAGAWTTDLLNWTGFTPSWTPSSNAQAFVTPEVKKIKKGGEEVDFPQFNAYDWSKRTDSGYNIDGNMWAPDVIWNTAMQKWCMYLSINGDQWHSSIILLTSANIQGPYKYQGPVVISGFDNGSHSFKDTDLELVLGTLSAVPSRYSTWASTRNPSWPNNIDPCVFYDEDGQLWMAYGSWSGGVFMLELDEETGLRDYDVTYPSATNSDPYFGRRIAGGYYVSGEGAYIEHIGDYYYLFMSYGGLDQKGGYEMRVFRSDKPDGPYKDPAGREATYTSYTLNFGPNATGRGAKLLGPYSDWGFMPQGERSQGHNSIIAAQDGRTYLVYHTRFCNADKKADEGHQVRVHQTFLNKQGWLVAAPFEYNGETVTDADIATTQPFTLEELAGTYQVLIHKFANDHNNLEQVEPISLTLGDDGRVTGPRTGTWSIDEGTGYISLTLNGLTYHGVVLDETMDTRNVRAVAITALSTSGVGLWAYKMQSKYALAWQLNNQTVPVVNNQQVTRNIDLYSIDQHVDNVSVSWTSSQPDALSDYGRYDPTGLTDDEQATLSVSISTTGYYWAQDYSVKLLSAENSKATADWQTGMLAHYGFDDSSLKNTFDADQRALLLRQSTTTRPALLDDEPLRNGSVVHLNPGANGKESYVSMPNPLKGLQLDDGATIAFYVKRADDNLWDALYGFVNGNARLYMTGNLYTGYNDGDGTWLDVNHPSTVTPGTLTTDRWQFVVVTFQRTATSTSGGITVYVDGTPKRSDRFNGSLAGQTVTTKQGFDYNRIVDHIAASPNIYLGYGSFWGSPDARFDDVMVFSRALSLTEVMALRQMTDRVFSPSSLTNSVPSVAVLQQQTEQAYDLQGRRVAHPSKGLYIINGKKIIVK